MVDRKLRDGYNRTITRRRIVISSFVKNKTVGDFNVSVRSLGRLRSKPLIRSSIPYFTGSGVGMKLIIKKVMEGELKYRLRLKSTKLNQSRLLMSYHAQP